MGRVPSGRNGTRVSRSGADDEITATPDHPSQQHPGHVQREITGASPVRGAALEQLGCGITVATLPLRASTHGSRPTRTRPRADSATRHARRRSNAIDLKPALPNNMRRGSIFVLPHLLGARRVGVVRLGSSDDGRHSSPVPSDTLATGGRQGSQQRTSPAADALEVRRTFVASRLSAVYLAAAYAQVVPRHRRRMGLTEIRQSPFAEAAEKRTAGEGRGNS